jgi:hypothetical protein
MTTVEATVGAKRDYLAASSLAYESLVRLVVEANWHKQPERALSLVEWLALFASMHHPGRYADARLENLAVALSRDLALPDISETLFPPRDGRRSVLHAATTVHPKGGRGHTMLIENWARTDRDSRHSLILTRQGTTPLPAELEAAIRESGGTSFVIRAGAGPIERAAYLRSAAYSSADVVVLHQHPNDVSPLVAFAPDGGPPVLVMNHGDHKYWIGNAVADLLVNFRHSGEELARARRHVRRDILCPLPLAPLQAAGDRKRNRSAIGVDDDRLIVLSVGAEYKYVPTPTRSFWRAARQLLDWDPHVHIYLIGCSRVAAQFADQCDRDRLHFVGELPSAEPYFLAADLYVEGFPFGSQTALLEAAFRGCAVVLAPDCGSRVMATDDPALDGVIDVPRDEDDYVRQAVALLGDESRRWRLAARLAERIRDVHVGEAWLEQLHRVYDLAAGLQHSTATLEHRDDAVSADDEAWSDMLCGAGGDRDAKEFLNWFVPSLAAYGVGIGPLWRADSRLRRHLAVAPVLRRKSRLVTRWLWHTAAGWRSRC